MLRCCVRCAFPMTRRDAAVERLSDKVFARGNVHLKNVSLLSALPEGLHSFPEVCFIGKPNVGKSSIISCLLHNQRLGRSGCQRGTTRKLQFFNVGDALLLVDTPGYGGWKGRELPQKLAERASAFAILFRYLALRKRGPLKRLYWVMEAGKTIQPRDEELFDFLQTEQIPFSVIVNKIDRFRGDPHAMRDYVNRVWDFLGTDSVPVLGIRASPRKPEKCMNIATLQHDITYYCTQEISSIENLTCKQFKELSYAPPSSEEIRAVERRYPVESFIVPQDDNLSLKCFVAQHERAKAKLLAACPQAAMLSIKDKMEGHLVNVGSDKNSLHNCSTGGNFELSEDVIHSGPKNELLDSVGDSQKLKTCEVIQYAEVTEAHDADLARNAEHRSVEVAQATDEGKMNILSHPEETDHEPVVPFSISSVPDILDKHSHSVRAINGVHIPKSMITKSVAQLSASQEGSLENFAQHSSAGSYDALLSADANGDGIFLETAKVALLSEAEQTSLQRHATKSARKRRTEKLLTKYVERKRQERSIYVQAQGYMCPWLAGAGQPSRVAVVGLAENQSSIGRGGSLMKGLKRVGFGGKSYSACTMKNRGRATKKVGFWAS